MQHATVAVAVDICQPFRSVLQFGKLYSGGLGIAHERTKRSRFNHLVFLGLNFINLLKRTWATGAMPLSHCISTKSVAVGSPTCAEQSPWSKIEDSHGGTRVAGVGIEGRVHLHKEIVSKIFLAQP